MASPGASITSENRGPAVNIASWISLVTMCLITLLKVFSKLFRFSTTFRFQSLQADDYAILFAMLAAIGQSIAVSQQVSAGLGQHITTLNPSQIETYQKAGYSSEFLYIAALCSAKLATLWFLITVARRPAHRRLVFGTMAFTTLWALIALLGMAFQCAVPHSWAIISDNCFDQRAFWDGISTFDIIIDIALIGIPIFVLWDLQLPWSKKTVVLFAFALRSINIPLDVLRLVYIAHATGSSDRTYDDFAATVTTQVAMNVSIAVACVPFLKQFLDHIQPGWSTSDTRTGLGYNTIVGRSGKDYAMGSVVKSTQTGSTGVLTQH